MPELLHAWALAPAAVGTCVLAADHRRVRAPELVASVLMLAAMLDSALGSLVAPVFWAALLLAGAMALAAVRRRRPRAGGAASHGPGRPGTGMTVHTGIGMVAMAALLLAMGRADAAATAHSHGVTGAALSVALIVGTIAYVVGSAAAAVRAKEWLDRMQYAAMGASTLVMGAALVA